MFNIFFQHRIRKVRQRSSPSSSSSADNIEVEGTEPLRRDSGQKIMLAGDLGSDKADSISLDQPTKSVSFKELPSQSKEKITPETANISARSNSMSTYAPSVVDKIDAIENSQDLLYKPSSTTGMNADKGLKSSKHILELPEPESHMDRPFMCKCGHSTQTGLFPNGQLAEAYVSVPHKEDDAAHIHSQQKHLRDTATLARNAMLSCCTRHPHSCPSLERIHFLMAKSNHLRNVHSCFQNEIHKSNFNAIRRGDSKKADDSDAFCHVCKKKICDGETPLFYRFNDLQQEQICNKPSTVELFIRHAQNCTACLNLFDDCGDILDDACCFKCDYCLFLMSRMKSGMKGLQSRRECSCCAQSVYSSLQSGPSTCQDSSYISTSIDDGRGRLVCNFCQHKAEHGQRFGSPVRRQ
nr:PREDICTED: uncharacterized protein LOC102346153 [Latimeria chalumnae]XP_005986738.1 PREDICTED: uncharacterized protein LOC102346153 [Latimeria chalumnae]XP_005986739.1 PREDICTED: uncharacterized protein LOC102346153 [Latimeria chalumnae]XP_005986740.1 PREDICTED: uncharacterized protein LOC102346153 [Latimeria chalumnae]|eukprot:XP_005986737.1 PREDICTED: uncharacterized protein LOC102346153 [Latimeria chalumnae]